PDFTRGVCLGEHEAPHLAYLLEALGVWDDGLRLSIVQVTRRGHVRSPAFFELRAVPPLHVLRERVHVVLGEAEEHTEHELALRAVLKGKGRELQILERALVEEIDEGTRINRIS